MGVPPGGCEGVEVGHFCWVDGGGGGGAVSEIAALGEER